MRETLRNYNMVVCECLSLYKENATGYSNLVSEVKNENFCVLFCDNIVLIKIK